MQIPAHGRSLLFCGFAAAFALLSAPAAEAEAAPAPSPSPAPAATAQDAGSDAPENDTPADAVDGMGRKERREVAKQKRIDEYLRKKAAREAKKDQQKLEKALSEAEAAEFEAPGDRPASPLQPGSNPDLLDAEPVPADEAMHLDAEQADKERRKRLARLPRRLAQVQEQVRASRLGTDPTVIAYLDKIELQEASAQQLAAFGSFLSQNGLVVEAQEYYQIAVNVERKDPVLWLNLGILQRQTGDNQRAAASFARALSINPNNAAAHYNLGATMDEMGKYEEALEEYKIALRLDPALGDPSVNPQAANNERLMAVKLMLYKEQSGSATLPLAEVPGGGLEDSPEQRR